MRAPCLIKHCVKRVDADNENIRHLSCDKKKKRATYVLQHIRPSKRLQTAGSGLVPEEYRVPKAILLIRGYHKV
jgi:hypothetical protein